MSFEQYSPRVLAGSAIVLAHVAVLYGLAITGLRLESTDTNLPIAVRLISSGKISSAEPGPLRQPPRVAAFTPAVFSRAPQMPSIEIPVTPALSNHAISIPTSANMPAIETHDDRNAPKWISAVEYVREPAPRYPQQSRRLREQGLVVLRVLIDEQGNARSIDIERSSGHERLDVAAREAIERAAFRPYLEGGMPRRALVLIPVEFALNRGTA